MKATKRLVALAAAATMTACAAIPMVAMNVSAATITVTDTTASGTSDTLKAFQIFQAQMISKGTGAASEAEQYDFVVIGWGDGIDVDKLKAALKADASMAGAFGGENAIEAIDGEAEAGAQELADKLSGFASDSTEAKTFAKIAARCVKGTGTESTKKGTAEDETIQFSVNIGYYIIVDTAPAAKDNYTAYTLDLLKVVDNSTNLTVTPKREYPIFDKKIGDRNDTNDTPNSYTYDEAADHDINDDVPFQLIASMPDNIGEYAAYSLTFYDDLQADVFKLNVDSIKVYYVQGATADTGETDIKEDVTSAFTITTDWSTVPADETFSSSHTDKRLDFIVQCGNIKDILALQDVQGVDYTGQFVVEYTAQLTEDAKLGATGNWNGAYLEYSNNPNWDGSGTSDTGKSPVDYVVAFTYQAVVNKIDGVTQNPLAGAEFKLYKKVKTADPTESSILKDTGITPKYNTGDADTATSFEFRGLDDGEYVLKETNVPDGYTGAADIEFTISTFKKQIDGFEALVQLKSHNTAVTAGYVFELATNGSEYQYVRSTTLGAVSVTVENKKGQTLPSTGGIGTTIFYVVGSLMVGVAGVYLIAKKRMNNNEQ